MNMFQPHAKKEQQKEQKLAETESTTASTTSATVTTTSQPSRATAPPVTSSSSSAPAPSPTSNSSLPTPVHVSQNQDKHLSTASNVSISSANDPSAKPGTVATPPARVFEPILSPVQQRIARRLANGIQIIKHGKSSVSVFFEFYLGLILISFLLS
jgi:hypothetical protein